MADAIWNNNYLLSNMAAQKLYAQSPLTTGVSGSSAYIGIEPSARYNETVLYSATANPSMVIKNQVSSYNLSETIDNFEKIKLNFVHSYGFGTYQFNNSVELAVDPFHNGMDGASDVWKIGLFDANNFTVAGTTLTVSGDGRYKILANGTVAADMTARGASVLSVIGINRKEV